jgi:hypothetical protein
MGPNAFPTTALPRLVAGGFLLALAACGAPDATQGGEVVPGSTDARGSTGAPDIREPVELDPDTPTWAVTLHGAGPIRFGMTVAQASGALGTTIGASPQGCDYASMPGAPAGMRFMVVDGRIVRADVDSAGLPSDRGAAVGMTAAEVQRLYGDSLAIVPHKYDTAGRYLVFAPPTGDTAYRVLFETSGDRVVRYRAGRVPEVEWVEGCG